MDAVQADILAANIVNMPAYFLSLAKTDSTDGMWVIAVDNKTQGCGYLLLKNWTVIDMEQSNCR